MFEKLTDLAMKRSSKQAFGFYIVYFILSISAAFLVGAVAGIVVGSDATIKGYGLKAGVVVSIIFCTSMTLFIVRKKPLNHIGYYFAILGAALLSLIGGALLGMIIPAYLTTREDQKEDN